MALLHKPSCTSPSWVLPCVLAIVALLGAGFSAGALLTASSPGAKVLAPTSTVKVNITGAKFYIDPAAAAETKQSLHQTAYPACGLHGNASTIPWPGGLHQCACVSLEVPQYPLRRKLLIIIPETTDRKGRIQTAHVVDNFQRYCKRHGYLFQLHHFEPDDAVGLMGTRWKVMLLYWHMADWLLLLDSDTVVANMGNSLDRFLDVPEHVILTQRPNREVIAGGVAVRTTEFGRCFLSRWLAVIQTTRMLGTEVNADNGALLLTLAEFLHPDLARQCATRKPDLLQCFEGVYERMALLPKSNLPIKVLPLLGGFWRQHERNTQTSPATLDCYSPQVVRTMMYERCWSNDVFISGWKQIGSNMWPNIGSDAAVAVCPFNSREDELKFAQLCCLVEYPGCYTENGTNTCKQQPHCQNPQAGANMQTRADLGFGICHYIDYDTAWKQSPLLRNWHKAGWPAGTLPAVHNHGVLQHKELHALMQETFVYAGFPAVMMGPAAMEAISQGMVFLNYAFDPPWNLSQKMDKPTTQLWTFLS